MFALFGFRGEIRPLPYALCSLGVFFSQHAVVLAVCWAMGDPPSLSWSEQIEGDSFDQLRHWPNVLGFLVLMPRSLVIAAAHWLKIAGRPSGAIVILILLTFAYTLVAAWALAALSFRRTADAKIDEWIAALAIAPVLQLPVIAFLCLVPSRATRALPATAAIAGAPDSAWSAAAQGVIAGVGLTLIAVAMGALLFGAYGFGMFVVSPFVIGAMTAYFANRKGDLGVGRTVQLIVLATALGAVALVVVALEGIVCIILAAPIGLGVAIVGGLFGRAVARYARRSASQVLSGFALLPLVFTLENVLPATTAFDTVETIEINAPPEAVWKSIVHMESIDEPLAVPFRLGVAYPLRGEIIGEGVGAARRGEFSTGTAVERVTEWKPNRKLAFVVVNDVPAMHEFSPYRHVHAPHVLGYFRTTYTSFELHQRSDDRTEIVEHTSHELRLDPVLYWLPIARWVVSENNTRVLAHLRHDAERRFRSTGDRPNVEDQDQTKGTPGG